MTVSKIVKILVVIPCLNERHHLRNVLRSILSDPLAAQMQIAVVDGGSSDGTQQIALDEASRHPQICLIHNKKRLQSAGTNLAVEMLGGDCDYVVRIDAHAEYPDHYVSALIETQWATEADSVVVSMVAVGERGTQKAIAIAQNSVFGTGGAAHRGKSQGRWVEHGHHALFVTEKFVVVRGYNEALSHNEDAELDMRLISAGYRIYLAPIAIEYHPRRSFHALFRQYYNYGRGRAITSVLHRRLPNLRRWIVLGVVPAIILVLASPWLHVAALPLFLWLVVVGVFAVSFVLKSRSWLGALAALAGATMQFAWSLGFHRQLLAELVRSALKRLSPEPAPS